MIPPSIIIGTDHGGYELKEALIPLLEKQGIKVEDIGTHSPTESVNYPVYANKVVEAILSGRHNKGILVCGTGLGMSYAANRFKGIRAALVPNEEYARLAAAHNNANIICLGGRMQTTDQALSIVNTWLNTAYEGNRHDLRIAMLDEERK